MDWKLELITVPVSDVNRAKAFYTEQVGFNADHDHTGQRRDSFRSAGAELVERGVEASEVRDLPGGRFVFFSDPDGNGWVVQLPAGG